MAALCAELCKCEKIELLWTRSMSHPIRMAQLTYIHFTGNKNGPIGATELLVTPVEYFKKRRRVITLVHSEKGVVVDDPRIALIPYDVRVKGFEACLQWVNRQDCESSSSESATSV